MKSAELKTLHGLAQMQTDAAQAKLAGVLRREQGLRRALADIDARFAAGRDMPDNTAAAMRQIGAQASWAEWALRRKTQINGELALVLAEKAEQLDALRKVMGRREALGTLAENSARGEARQRANKAADMLSAQHILDRMRPD